MQKSSRFLKASAEEIAIHGERSTTATAPLALQNRKSKTLPVVLMLLWFSSSVSRQLLSFIR
jgi:hypothetical protein